MGFTPWPYRLDGDAAEVAYTYDIIQARGDIVAHHFQQGIPWSEAWDMRADPQFSALPQVVKDEVNIRTAFTDTGTLIYLAVDSLGSSREDLIGYWGPDYNSHGSTEQQPRPNNDGGPGISGAVNSIDWGSKGFADQEIAEAFVAWARALIDHFESLGFTVAYFNYASEVSDLYLHDPGKYADFLEFAGRVYTALKTEYPDLPLMVSTALKHPASTDAAQIETGLASGTVPVTDSIDLMGISVYPYAFFNPMVSDDSSEGSNGLADLPADWASQITGLSGGKPVAFTETGWIAEDLSISEYGLDRYSSEVNQRSFTELLFAEAQELGAQFIIWFSAVDYSHFWVNSLGADSLSALWRDTGLYDYDGTTDIGMADLPGLNPAGAGLIRRSALDVWETWLSYSRRQERE